MISSGRYRSYFFGVLFLVTMIGFIGCPNSDEMFVTGGNVRSVELNVDNANFTGTCPHTFHLTGILSTSGSGLITYVWERSTGNSNPEVSNIPVAGQLAILDSITMDASGSVTVKLHVTEPNDISSNTVTLTANCQ